MVDTVEPVVGRTADASQHRQLVVDAMDALNWVPNGYTTTDGGGLIANVAAGRAFLAGALAERDVLTALTMVDAATNRIFVYIDDILDDGVVYFHVDQDDTPPTQGPSHKIATVTTSGGAITLITDERRTVPELTGGLKLNAALEMLSGDIILAGLVDGVDVSAHPHGGAGQGGTVQHADLGGVSGDQHHAQVHVAASTGPHAESGLTIGHVLRASGASAFSFAQLLHPDLGSILADDHHAQAHVVGSTGPHAQSGLTTGHVLRASGASAFDFAQLQHTDLGGILSGQHHTQDHASRHEPSGADPMAVDAAVGIGSLRTLGDGALQARPGNAVPDVVYFGLFIDVTGVGNIQLSETTSTTFVTKSGNHDVPTGWSTAEVIVIARHTGGGTLVEVQLRDTTAGVSRGSGTRTAVLYGRLQFSVSGLVPGNTHALRMKVDGGTGQVIHSGPAMYKTG